MRLKLAILASGSGSNAQAIIEASQKGVLNADVKVVFSNKTDAKVLERAKNLNVPCVALAHKNYPDRESFDKAMVSVLKEHGADTIAMAGYMRIVTPYFINTFQNRILNIHPAILPSFAGANGIDDAWQWGVKISGCTVHFVNEVMDSGAIIIQAALPFHTADIAEFETSLHEIEHTIYIQALKWFSEERLEIVGRKTKLLPKQNAIFSPVQTNILISPPLEDN